MWNSDGKHVLWNIDSEWSENRADFYVPYAESARRVLSLYERELADRLSKDEYAQLAERGFIKTNGDYDGNFKASWQIVVLENKEIQTKLLAIGDKIKEKYKSEFDSLKVQYTKAELESVPAHLQKIKKYELQFLFNSDGWFLLHCIKTLLGNGKLHEPTVNQKKSLTTLITNA